jgi:KaiC/GvpD/RAD55 family RecA-like ATPase
LSPAQIPPEIINQCKEGGSMLIRGGPGSGKTIMAVSLLSQLKAEGQKVHFISGRLPVGSLFRTTPLFNELLPDSIIDASMQRKQDDEPDVQTMPLGDLSDLAMIYLRTAEKESVVVLDSWDAVLQREKRSEEEVYTAAMDLINRTPGSLVMITEGINGVNPLEHVVDVHVSLDAEMYQGNIIRLLQVKKLRGQYIKTPSYIFTLSGGMFQHHDPNIWTLHEHPIRANYLPEPIPENDGHFSTGMTRLDRILNGGYRAGSYVCIEVDPEAPLEACDLTFLPTAADFLSKGRPVVALPPGARDADSLWETVRGIFDEPTWQQIKTDLIDELVRVLSYGSREDGEATVNLGTDIQTDLEIWNKAKKELRYKSGKPILGIVGYDTLSRVYGREQVEPIIGSSLPETRYRGDLVICLVTSDLDIKGSLLGVSDYYFRLHLHKGLPVFWGVKPKTPLFTIGLANDKGCPKTNIENIS